MYYSFQVHDSAGFNGTIYLRASNDVNNIFYKSGAETAAHLNLLFTKNLGGASGHCLAIDYIFNKWFPKFRSQKPSCLSNPQNITVEIGTQNGNGILNGSRLYFENGEQYPLLSTFTPETINALAYSTGKKLPIERVVHLNDLSNSKLTYTGSRP